MRSPRWWDAPRPPETRCVTGVASLSDAGPGDLSFLNSEAFLTEFKSTSAAAVLVQKQLQIPEATRHGRAAGG